MNDLQNANQFVVDESTSGLRLDAFVTLKVTDISRSQLQKIIAEGKVLVNGEPGSKSNKIKDGDLVKVTSLDLSRHLNSSPLIAQDIPISILYEDEFIVAINKPAGLVVHPGNGNPDGTLVNALLYKVKTLSEGPTDRPGIVHRLDKNTSGVILVAKTNSAHTALSNAFSGRLVNKIYAGFCIGKQPEEHGEIDLALGRSKREPLKRANLTDGKPSLTEFWCETYKAGIAALKFKLHTGRTHQIRVHCSCKGFPIVADDLYGGGKERISLLPPSDRPFANAVYKCFERHALHAWSISFVHPFTKRELTIVAPLPDDFIEASKVFGRNGLFEPV